MNVIYDPETDTLSIIFRKTKVSESDELRDGIIIDMDTMVRSSPWKSLMPQNRFQNLRGYFMN